MKEVLIDLPLGFKSCIVGGVKHINRRLLGNVGSILHSGTNDEGEVPLSTDTNTVNIKCIKGCDIDEGPY